MTAPPDLWPWIWVAAPSAVLIFTVSNPVPMVLEQSGVDRSPLGPLVSSLGAGNILSGPRLARKPASNATPAG